MFDIIIREAASRFGLGDKAGPLVQMLLAYITNKDTGGLSGFMSKLSSSGLGDVAKSWLGGGSGALPVSSTQIESLMGGQDGLLSSVTSKLGIGGSTASSALGFILPMVIGKLTPGGTVPTSLSSEIMGFITGGASALKQGVTGAAAGAAGLAAGAAGAVGSAAGTAAATAGKVVDSAGHVVGSAANAGAKAATAAGNGFMKWLPWIAAAIAALFLLSYCNKSNDAAKQAEAAKSAVATADAAKAEAEAKAKAEADAKAKADAEAAAKAAAEVVPAGSGLVAYTRDDAPALKVYFDTGKTDVAAGFGETAKALVEHLKTNATSKAIVSGFNDPTGNAAANAELSKNRAKAVAAALVAAGVAQDRVVLEKPADTTGSVLSNSEARRVEVFVRK